jgi:diguanylate cyclase (GGDEF)-like protein
LVRQFAENSHAAGMGMEATLQRKKEKRARLIRNLGALAAIAVVTVLLEVTFDAYRLVDEAIEAGEDFHSHTLFAAILITGLTFLVFQSVDFRRELRRRRAAEERALHLAYQDPLTGLGNRRSLERALAELVPGDLRAVMMLDLDDFKPVNDIFGHAAGDTVLKDAARRLISICGDEASVCRFGGDEFAILTRTLGSPEEAELLARRIAAAFEQPFLVGSAESRIGISLGVAMHDAGRATAQDTIRHADLALYRAKDDHITDFKMFEQHMDDELRRRKEMERKLRRAIEVGAVRPYFQPLVNLKSSELIGFEALARWTDPEFGAVPPSEFIALAEETGLITELSEHLLRLSCREAVRWPSHLKLSFNLSPKQLRDRLIGLRVLAILGECGLSPHRLEIEVTESSLVEDKELARELLNGLRAAGVRIAIDDFGTGYSSLYHLREFKFDNLKIDRSFVTTMQRSGENAVIIQSILALSRGLGLTATAEGIEREDQLAKLVSSGCEQGQGYLFGRAMSGADVMAMIDELSPPAQAAG